MAPPTAREKASANAKAQVQKQKAAQAAASQAAAKGAVEKSKAQAAADSKKGAKPGAKGSQTNLPKTVADTEAQIATLTAEAEQIKQQDELAKYAFLTKLDQGTKDAASFLHALIYFVGAAYLKKESGQSGAFGDVNSTANLLEMLSDKKAIMTNGSLPGTYRYYSASHPTAEQQGQMIPRIDLRDKMKKAALEKKTPYLEGKWKDTPVATFVTSNEKTWMPGAKEPDCKIDNRTPVRGINVYTNNPEAPNGEVLPTSEIRELMFASHEVTGNGSKDDHPKDLNLPDLGTAKVQEYIDEALAAIDLSPEVLKTGTINTLLSGWREGIRKEVDAAVESARAALSEAVKSSVPNFPFPEAVSPVVRNVPIPRDVVLGGGAYKFADIPDGKAELFPGASGMTLAQVWSAVAQSEAKTLYDQAMGDKKGEWYKALQTNLGSNVEDISLTLSHFLLSQAGGDAPKQKRSVRKRTVKVRNISSPVFPVSDGKGYEVIGSFRYGRDINIDPEGVFESLHNTDIFAVLNKNTLDNLIRLLVKGESITIQGQIGTTADGKPINGPKRISGKAAVTELERNVLQDLRSRMTDDQIIDLGIAKRGSNPTMLDMQLQNWFSEQGREGVHKIQLANVGYSLADITMNNSKSVCSCKMAEADVFLEAAGQDNFVQYVQPGVLAPSGTNPETLDRPTQWSISIAAQASMGWKMSQDAIRGMIPADKPSSIVKSVLALSDIDDSIKANTDEARAQLAAAKKKLSDIGSR